MRPLTLAIIVIAALAANHPAARADAASLQRSFMEAVQLLEAGDARRAEQILRDLVNVTNSPRVKLELARTLYLQGKYEESKRLFQEVSMQPDTPWRVRDNITLFVQQIEEKTGYLKFGVTLVSDSNPRNLAAQKEFSIGDLRVTPTEAPKKVYGLRYSARGWLPIHDGASAYLAASYTDYPGADFDRMTTDIGVTKALTESGRVRGKAGVELGSFGGKLLYQFPYVGLDSVIAESSSYRLAGELKLGKIKLPDFGFQDAVFSSGAVSLRYLASESVTATMRTGVEYSRASERPYSYYGWDFGPGANWLWAPRAYLIGVNASVGAREYADVDRLFGKQRSDSKTKLELTLGNKQWRWRNNYATLVASLEENRSNIDFYGYRKANLSVSIE
jgi:hypothetical protein